MANSAPAHNTLRERFEYIVSRIEASTRACGRSFEEITLVAISKTHSVSAVISAMSLGLRDFGENRVQEAEPKIIGIGREKAHWHLVGHLQANKARRAVNLFDVIHSLDSAALARRLDRFCREDERNELPVLIQVDIAGEETKSGVPVAELPDLVRAVHECTKLRLDGLMTLPPFFEDVERVRPFFTRLRELRDELHKAGHFGERRGELSMGMSHDFEVAIEEGATMLRIGTAIFGERNSAP